MQPATSLAPRRIAVAPPLLRRRLALVVDEDVESASMAALALGTEGWHTIVANDPLTAAALARDLPVDILVAGHDMPGMSGVDLAAVVRVHHANLPVLLMSHERDGQHPAVEPPFMFLAKPFRLRALYRVIDSLAGSVGVAGTPGMS